MKLMKKGKESLTAYMAALILQLEKEGRPGTAHVAVRCVVCSTSPGAFLFLFVR